MNRILSTAAVEFRIALRNRWVAIAVALMVVFALVLAAGAAPTGDIGADRLSVIVASLTSLRVYLVPLIALLMSFDAIAGKVERGTLPLLLTYSVCRAEVLTGKLLAHLAILTPAVRAGYGTAALAAIWADPASLAGLPALGRLVWNSVLLRAVVLYDLALLALIVSDGGGVLTTQALPVALLANPADAFRLFNLAAAFRKVTP
jgi:Cu-processing system permease protein